MQFPNMIKLNGKTPVEKGWQRWCEEVRTPRKTFKGNYGLPCGPANKILVLDIDNPAQFKSSGKETPPTYTIKTAKGYHLYYRYPPANGAEYHNVGNKVEGYDIRGLGGQVVGPGSIHPDTGITYEIYRDIPIADPPKWMLDEARWTTTEMPNALEEWDAATVVEGDNKSRPGDLFNDQVDIKTIIEDAGWKPMRRTGALRDGTPVQYYTRPGKRKGISGSIIDGKYFYSFSTDCAPLEPERAYDAFGLYTVLHHDGNFTAAAKTVLPTEPSKASAGDGDDFKELVKPGFKDIEEARRAIQGAKTYSALRQDVLPLCRGVEDAWRLEGVVLEKVKALGEGKPPVNVVREWLSEANEGLTEMPTWGVDWCYLTAPGKFFNLATKEKISERSFNLLFKEYLEGQPSELLAESGVLPRYSDAIYLPGAGNIFEFEGRQCVNLFRPWPKATGEMDQRVADIILDHAQRRFGDDWRILIDFLAWCVQNPGKKLQWVLLIQGAQGDGKTFWSRMMTTIMGVHNTREIDPVVVQSNFTGWAAGSVFGIMEEIRLSGHNRFEIMDRTKSFFTNPRISIHRKGEEPYDVPNVTNYLLLTNHKDALPIQSDDRRYCVLFSSCQSKGELEPNSYFDKLYSVLEDRDSLLLFLEGWKVSDEFRQFQAPAKTAAQIEMEELNKSDLYLEVERFFEEHPEQKEKVRTREIADWMDVPVSQKAIALILGKMGYDLKIEKDKGKTARNWHRRLGF